MQFEFHRPKLVEAYCASMRYHMAFIAYVVFQILGNERKYNTIKHDVFIIPSEMANKTLLNFF